MDMVKIFRLLVVVNFMVAISYILIDYNSLIVSKLDLSAAIEESYLGVMASWNVVVLMFFMLAAFITGPLLFFFVKWSREILIGVLGTVLIVHLLDGSNGSYILNSQFQFIAFSIEALTHGAILAIAYLTPVKDKFN